MGWVKGVWTPWKITNCSIFLRHAGTDLLEKQVNPWLYLKHVGDSKRFQDPHLTEFSGSAHDGSFRNWENQHKHKTAALVS